MVCPAGFLDAKRRASEGTLKERTSLRVGGAPEFLFEPGDVEEAAEVVRACARERVPLRVLGGGCNLLVADGRLEGAVLSTARLRHERVLADRVEVGAGNPFPGLVARAADLGIPALSGCPGIPGQVGGVVAMNAGGRFGHVSDALLEVTYLDLHGRLHVRAVEPGDFGYRQSLFLGTSVVVGAAFRRDARRSGDEARRRFLEAAAWKRATQPLSAASAGCIFRNPGAGRSAGALIDAAGLKGERCGGALVSPVHGNFIVNDGGATASDVEALIGRVRERVLATDGVFLDLEVQVWR